MCKNNFLLSIVNCPCLSYIVRRLKKYTKTGLANKQNIQQATTKPHNP